MIVATAHVSVDGQSLWLALDGEIVYLQILQCLVLQCKTATCHRLPEVIIYDHTPCAVIELHGATSSLVYLLEEGAVSLGDVFDEVLCVRIKLVSILYVVATEEFGKELCWSRNSLLSLDAFLLKLLHKLVVLDERMVFT